MGRPAGYQWQPLGLDTDPVPGDPARISAEARHLASVASEIASQVAALRKIGSDNIEVGQHADEIRSQASSLADQLDKLVGRYTKCSAALNSWVPELEQAQAMSIQALDQAEGPYQKLHQTVILPSGPNMTAQQKQSVTDYHNSMNQAQSQLNDALALLNRATTLRDNAGSNCANAINNACNDGMRDHWSLFGSIAGFFTSMFSWVTGHWAKMLADVCTVLEVVATVLAIAAFIIAQFVPGLNILVDGVFLTTLLVGSATILTAAALIGRIVLASTHNGSWMDVGVDAFALATFGMGRLASAVARALVPGAEVASKLAVVDDLVAGGGKETAMFGKFVDLMGADRAATVASKFADAQVAKVVKGAELKGFAKIMISIGGFTSKEEATYAELQRLGTRFATPMQYTRWVSALSGVTGVTSGLSGLTGITATALNGWATNYMGNLNPLGTHKWYTNTFEIPTGAPAGG